MDFINYYEVIEKIARDLHCVDETINPKASLRIYGFTYQIKTATYLDEDAAEIDSVTLAFVRTQAAGAILRKIEEILGISIDDYNKMVNSCRE